MLMAWLLHFSSTNQESLMSNEKRSQDKGELTVESDEPHEEQEIEVNEKNLPPKRRPFMRLSVSTERKS